MNSSVAHYRRFAAVVTVIVMIAGLSSVHGFDIEEVMNGNIDPSMIAGDMGGMDDWNDVYNPTVQQPAGSRPPPPPARTSNLPESWDPFPRTTDADLPRATRTGAPSALELDEMMRRLESGGLSETERKRFTAIVFYHQDVYRKAVLEGLEGPHGKLTANSSHVQAFIESKRQFHIDVAQRMAMEYKAKHGQFPKQTIIPFDYKNILSDDDLIIGSGKAGRDLVESYNEALSKTIYERIKVPMTGLDRERIDVNGVAWNMTLQGGLEDFRHKERYINPQSGHANQAKLIEGVRNGQVNAFTFDESGRVITMDADDTVEAIKRLGVEDTLKIPGLDARFGTGSMSDFYRMADEHKVQFRVLDAEFHTGNAYLFPASQATTEEVGTFIRNQKYTNRLAGDYERVFSDAPELSREFRGFLDASAEIRNQTTVKGVAEVLERTYNVRIINAGEVDWAELTRAMQKHQARQLTELMPRMIQAVANSEAAKIARWLKTATGVDRRSLRKQLAMAYSVLPPDEVGKIARQLDHIDLSDADRKFLQAILTDDTRQLRSYAEAINKSPRELVDALSPDARSNMAVVELIENENTAVRRLYDDLDTRPGGTKFREFLRQKTAQAFNLDNMLDNVKNVSVTQAGIFVLMATRAWNASQSPAEGSKQVLLVGLEMVPFVAGFMRFREGEYKEAIREWFMDAAPPLALAQLAYIVVDFSMSYARSLFDEAVWEGHVSEMIAMLGEAEFEKADYSEYYYLKNRRSVLEFLDEIASSLGRVSKLAAVVEPEVEARLERTADYKTNREALATLQWFYEFDEETLKGQIKQRFDIKQLRARVYEQGVPGIGEDPTMRVAAKILADELRLRSEIYEKVLWEFVDRIEKRFNELKGSGAETLRDLLLNTMAKLREMKDEAKAEFSESDYALALLEDDYRKRGTFLNDYQQQGKELIDVQRDMSKLVEGFSRFIDDIRRSMNLFTERRALDLRVQVMGGDRSQVNTDYLIQGDVFRLGIGARVQPRRATQRWTAYYYAVNRGRWVLLGETDIASRKFQPASREGLWVVEAPAPETFYQVTGDQVAQYFDNAQRYYRVMAVLAFGDWDNDPMSEVGLRSLIDPMYHPEMFTEDRAAFASPVFELFTNPAQLELRGSSYVYRGQNIDLQGALVVQPYARDERGPADIEVEGPLEINPGSVNQFSFDPGSPSAISIAPADNASEGTYYLNVKARFPRLIPKYREFTALKPVTYIDQYGPDASGTASTSETQAASLDSLLAKMREYEEGARGLAAAAQANFDPVNDRIDDVMSPVDEHSTGMATLAREIEELLGRVSGAERIGLAAVQTAARGAKAVAGARDGAQQHALASCQAAEQVKLATDLQSANSFLNTARLEDDLVRNSKGTGEENLVLAESGYESSRSLRESLENAKRDADSAKTRVAEMATALGAATDLSAAQGYVDELMLNKNSMKNLVAYAEEVADQTRTAAQGDLSRKDQKAVSEIYELFGKLLNTQAKVDDLWKRAQAMVDGAKEKLVGIKTQLSELQTLAGRLDQGTVSAASLQSAQNAEAEARASFDTADVFMGSISHSADQSAACLLAAEQFASNLSPENQVVQSPEEICANGWAGSVFIGTYDDIGRPYCDCPSNMQWNDPVNKTHCVAQQVAQAPEEICSNGWAGSVFIGTYDDIGRPYCDCPSGMQWNDPVNKTHCIAAQVAQSPEQICSGSWPGSVFIGSYDEQGRPYCDCPSNMQWNDEVARNYCVTKPVAQSPGEICSNSWPNSVFIGTYDEQGRPYCDCPSGMQWDDPNARNYCMPVSLVADRDRTLCESQFPGSEPGPKDANGHFQCFCMGNTQWNDPNNPQYCVQGPTVQDQARCNRELQYALNATFINDANAYNYHLAEAQRLGCQVPPVIASWGQSGSGPGGSNSGGGWTGSSGPGGSGPGGNTTGGSTSSTGQAGCARASDQVLGQGNVTDDCLPNTMPPPIPPPENIRQ